MKKSIFFAAFAALLTLASVNVTYAQSKQDIKEAKKTAKVLEKEGWSPRPAIRTIESYLLSYYSLTPDNELLPPGRSSGIVGEKVAQSFAIRNAIRQYVEMNNSFFEGVGNELEGKVGGKTIDDVTNAVKSRFAGAIEKNVRLHFVLFKKEPDGTDSCVAYCFITSRVAEEAKEYARQQAMKEAMDDAKSVKDFNSAVNEIIKDGK